MAITKQFGPSSVSYGQSVYESAKNQERYRRSQELMSQNTQNRAIEADSRYKMGMLELEKDKWAKQWPLLEKEMDLREVETWLSKSVEYFKTRATAAGQRLQSRSDIFRTGQVGSTPESSRLLNQGETVSTMGQGGRNWFYGVKLATPERNISLSNKSFAAQLEKVDEQYRAELARIDEVFGVSQGWTPRLFMDGAPDSWQAPPSTPAFGQDPLTGTQPRNDPGASSTPFSIA